MGPARTDATAPFPFYRPTDWHLPAAWHAQLPDDAAEGLFAFVLGERVDSSQEVVRRTRGTIAAVGIIGLYTLTFSAEAGVTHRWGRRRTRTASTSRCFRMNVMTILLLSRGVHMLLAGDEIQRTQAKNVS